MPLIQNFYRHPPLLHHLRLALILKSRMFLDPDPSYCLNTQVRLGFHPTNSDDEISLYTGPYTDLDESREMPGVLEVREIGVTKKINASRPLSVYDEYTEIMVRLWRQAKQKADSLGRRGFPIMIVDFEYEHQEITLGIELPPDAILSVWGKPIPDDLRLKLPEDNKDDTETPAKLVSGHWKGYADYNR